MTNQCFRIAKLGLYRVKTFKQRLRLFEIAFKHLAHHPQRRLLPEQKCILVIGAESKRTVLRQDEVREKAELIQPCRHIVVVVPRTVIAAMAALQSHATGNVNSIAQYAALAALQGPQDCVQQMKQSFERRRSLMLDCVKNAGLTASIQPQGAFYLLLDIRSAIGKSLDGKTITDDLTFSELLLAHSFVAVVPGSPFGAPGFVRLSYAAADTVITQAMERIGNFMRALQ